MEKLDFINNWLGLFGKSQIYALNDINGNTTQRKGNFDWSIIHSDSEYVSVNEENPFGLFFTPNGNLGKINTIGDKVVRSKEKCDKSIYAFYIDIDIKDTDFTSIEKLKQATLDTIYKESFPVSYIIQSGGGFHLYMFIEEGKHLKVGGVKFKLIQEEFAKRFEGGDLSSHSVNKLMRLPYSNHWKTLQPIGLKLYKLFNTGNEIEIEEVNNADDISFPTSYLPMQYVLNMNSNISDKSELRIEMGSSDKQREIDGDIVVINNIEIIKVIGLLNKKNDKYPKQYMGYNYRYYTDGIRINIETTDLETGLIASLETSGYRINIDSNYVHNFSGENHSIEERPRGGTFSFLYYYFDKDIGAVKEFLENEFGIILKQKENYGYLNIKTFHGVIVFSKDGVFYNKEIKGKNGNEVVQKTLFEVPIEIIGVFASKYTSFGEAEHDNNYYIIKRLDMLDNNEIIVNFSVDRKSFNRTYGSTGLVFFGGEEDMLSFYSALNKASLAGQVKKLNFEYLNGFKEDKLILGNNIYDKDFNLLDHNGIVLKTQRIDLNIKGKEECSVKEFASKFTKLFSTRVSVLSIVTYISLFLGHDFWKIIGTYKQQNLMPGMIVSGKTRAGKTTLLSILKEGSGLSIDTRKYSIKSTTPQPLKQAGTDSFLLHLEEFTGYIQPDKETIIRDILNKSITAKGTITGENLSFVYRSSLILDGERLPISQSVVNRTILIPMFESDKMGNEELLYDIKQYLFLPDLTNKALSINDGDKLKYFRQAEQKLINIGITGRNVMLYSFLLATNYIVKIVDNKLLLDTIKENFNLLGNVEVDSDDLSELFSHFIITNKIRPTVNYGDYENSGSSKIVGSITLNGEIMAEKRIDIINLLKKYKGEVKLDGYTIFFNTTTKDILGTKLLNYRQYFNFLN